MASVSEKFEDKVLDEETLYRRVQEKAYSYQNGEWRISSIAFNDSECKPSVDRAALCNYNPVHTRVECTDGIISLTAAEIRNEQIIVSGVVEYLLDVKPDPIKEIPNNPAHALIVPTPEYKSKNTFRKVREKLQNLANKQLKACGWTLEPSNLKDYKDP